MIYFDFDGTIVDVYNRYYQAFKLASGANGISLKDYVDAKKKLQKDSKLAKHFNISLSEDYFEKKLELLESYNLLKLDRLLVDSKALCAFFKRHSAKILTCRYYANRLLRELAYLGLEKLQSNTVVLHPKCGTNKRSYIKEQNIKGRQWLVGDSEAEANAADLFNVRVALVTTGLRDVYTLKNHQKCRIFKDISEVMAFINNLTTADER